MNSPARWPPLAPEFVVARGAAGRALALSLLADPARLAAVRGLVSGDLIAVTGVELPWVDGAEYFGRDGGAAWLLVSTCRASGVPTSWLERRYRAALPQVDWPCILLQPDGVLLPVGRAASLDGAALRAWCDRFPLTPTLSPERERESR